MWWSVRPHLAFPTVEIRISDAQPLQEDAISLAALTYCAGRADRPRDRRGRGAARAPNREIEENFWRAIRWGLSGEMIDLRTREVRPTRAAIEELIEWVRPVAEELGAARVAAFRRRTRRAADRPARGGREPRGDLRRAGPPEGGGRWLRGSELAPEELLEHIRQDEGLRPAALDVSTVAQLGYAKLEPAGRTSSRRSSQSIAARDVPVLEGGSRGGRARLQPGARTSSSPTRRPRPRPGRPLRVRPNDRRRRHACGQLVAREGRSSPLCGLPSLCSPGVPTTGLAFSAGAVR